MTKIINLRWSNYRIQHIARHNITPEEVEEVIFQDKFSFIQKREKSKKYPDSYIFAVFGSTLEGRLLMILLLNTPSGYYVPITARDMDDTERKYYQRRR
ncbi:MAG: hypothetical protein AB1796_04365 [Bacillota bacterium]